MEKYSKITPDGTRDYLFEECKSRRKAEGRLRKLYELFGYDEVMTTSLEFYDVFSEGVGRVSQNELYTLTDNGGRLITMRPDSTKPIARLYSSRLKDLPLPIKLYYRQPVFRRRVKYEKQSDEVMQMGLELIGTNSFKSDVEIIMLAIKTMEELFGDNYLLELGNMSVVRALLDLAGDNKQEIRKAIATKNVPMLKQLSCNFNGNVNSLVDIISLFGGEEVFEEAKQLFADNQDTLKAISDTKQIFDYIKENGLEKNVLLDLSAISEYEYYTGVVFKGYLKDTGEEIITGGRYDTLYNDYDISIPAIGFAVNLDAAMVYLVDKKNINKDSIAVIYSEKNSITNINDALLKYSKEGYKCTVALFEKEKDAQRWATEIGAEIFVNIDKE